MQVVVEFKDAIRESFRNPIMSAVILILCVAFLVFIGISFYEFYQVGAYDYVKLDDPSTIVFFLTKNFIRYPIIVIPVLIAISVVCTKSLVKNKTNNKDGANVSPI